MSHPVGDYPGFGSGGINAERYGVDLPGYADTCIAGQTVSGTPQALRFARYPDGRRVLQGAYPRCEGGCQGIEWRDIPLVQVDENGQEITLG